MKIKSPWYSDLKVRLLISLLFIIGFIIFSKSIDNEKVFNRAICREKQNMENKYFFVKITLKYNDSLNHNYNTLRFLDLATNRENLMYIINETGGFYNSINIGDSLIKETGSLDVQNVTRDTIYSLKYNCVED